MYAYFIDISQGTVETQIVCRVCQWKNFENRSIIGKDMDKSKVARFLAHPVHKASIFPFYVSPFSMS